MKNIKKFEVLDVTEKDIAIAFWYNDGSKDIVVLTNQAATQLLKQIKKGGIGYDN